ncbi:MAG: energy-coupling factor transporter ATPase [Firmicutes bacterium]|nr:energy-coupling factor transporter ATPase [Bacillota bacterium]
MKLQITIQDVSYSYRREAGEKIPALKGVNLTVEQGEYLAIIGPNGSGKSTLARHINALLIPDSGNVWVNGLNTKEEDALWEIRRLVGMVFQNPDNQIVATTVEEDVAFGLENLGLPAKIIRQRVKEALELVGLHPYTRHAPHFLSGGQKQRLAIAGTMVMKPRYLVLDEPTAMLDPQGREEVLQTIRRMNQEEKVTIIYITHFMEEALQADRICIMQDGAIYAVGRVEEIFEGELDLTKLGLTYPPVVELTRELRSAGLPIPPGIFRLEELVEFLCS